MFESIKTWIRRHNKGLFITVSVIGVISGAVILIVKGKRVEIPLDELAKRIILDDSLLPNNRPKVLSIPADGATTTFERASFIRHLHHGHNPSAAKINQAIEMGIALNPGETIVDACTVTLKAS